jgi:hypothetical protein
VDEKAHTGYDLSCEVARMTAVKEWATLGPTPDRPIIFFRFNPDGMRGVPKVPIQYRYDVLLSWIWMYRPDPGRTFEVLYFFYPSTDGEQGELSVLDEIEIRYPQMLDHIRQESIDYLL